MSNVGQPQINRAMDKGLLTAIIAGSVGNIVEWVDWSIYGLMAPLIAKQLFPPGDPTVALLQTYGAFLLGFLARPFGGTVLGIWGDKYGRSKTLAFTILLMAVSTGVLGVMPTYSQIGIWCPIIVLLTRIVQGFACGAEWGTATTFLYEYAPPNRRSWYSSWRPFTTGLGVIFASAIISGSNAIFSGKQGAAFGWRIPFIIGMIIGLFGLYIRTKIAETPEFAKVKEKREVLRNPLAESWKTDKRALLIVSGLASGSNVAYYYMFTYIPSYFSVHGVMSFAAAIQLNTLASMVYSVTLLIVGWAGDYYSRKFFLALSCFGFTILSYPFFMMFKSVSHVVIVTGVLVFSVLMGFFWGAVPTVIAELFPTRTRNTAIGMGYNWSTALFGGTAPMIATWLTSITGSSLTAAAYLVVTSALTLWAVLKCPVTAPSRRR